MKPAATLHDDGCWTWSGVMPYESSFAGWRLEVFTADQLRAAQVAKLREAGKEYGESKKYPGPCFRIAEELEKPLPAALHEIPKREDGVNAAGGTLSNNIGNPT